MTRPDQGAHLRPPVLRVPSGGGFGDKLRTGLYTGSLAATVELYASAGITNGTLFNLKVERGSGMTTLDNTMSCTGFTASSTAYNGALGSFPTTYGTGIDGKASGNTAWATNDSVDYRFTISVNDDTTANAHTTAMETGAHSFTWEARNS